MIPNHPTGMAIVARVAALYGVAVEMLLSKSKGSALVEARHLSWWKIRQDLGWSYPELGRCLGIDNTSARHGVRKTEGKIRDGTGSKQFTEAVQALDNQKPSEGTKGDRIGVSAAELPARDHAPAHPPAPPLSLISEGSSGDPTGSLISSDPRPVSKRARGPKPRLRNVPETWSPSDAHRALAKQLGVDFEHQLAMFRDHEFRDPKSNFDAAFRTWLRRSHSFGTPPGKSPTFPQDNARRPELALFKPKAEPTETVSAAELDALAKRVTGRGTI